MVKHESQKVSQILHVLALKNWSVCLTCTDHTFQSVFSLVSFFRNNSGAPPFNPAAQMNMPALPTYPSIQNDFRDYSRFNTASYRYLKASRRDLDFHCEVQIASVAEKRCLCWMHLIFCRVKKHFKGKCNWRCVALVFMFLTVALAAVVAYFVGKIFFFFTLRKKAECHLAAILYSSFL